MNPLKNIKKRLKIIWIICFFLHGFKHPFFEWLGESFAKGKTSVKFEDFWIGNLGKVGRQVTAFMDWMRGIEEVEMEDCHIFLLTSFFNYCIFF